MKRRLKNPYGKGRRFEYKTRDELKKAGFYVVRQAKSAFPDLFAFNQRGLIVVECKVGGRLTRTEKNKLREFRKLNCKTYLAHPVREGRHVKVKFKEEF